MFAARAFKSALFGTPAPPSDESRSKRQDKKASRKTTTKPERGSGTPTRPAGILLTPGTGATRRKRVSFGNHVAETAKLDTNKETAKVSDGGNDRHPRRDPSPKKPQGDDTGASKGPGVGPSATESEGEWEEENDDDYCTHDITVDLNEPHSQSGRYWKEEFEKYHEEAKAEMEKLLKYKQLAKSYARQKDAEAIRLAERLRDEQQKVIDMERKIAEKASQMVTKHRHASDDNSSESLSKLTKQTALAAQYRHRVKELEDELDELVRQKGAGTEGRGRRRHVATSPTTQKTLMETQRELRRARTQLKELDSLREEVSTLRARVRVAEAQASKADRDDMGSSGEGKARNLRAQLDQSREESRKKTAEMRQLQSDFERFRKESEAHEADTKAVLERARAKISDLKEEMRTLKAAGSDQPRLGSRRSHSDTGHESGSGGKGAEGAPKGEDDKLVHDSIAPIVQITTVQERGRYEADDAAKSASMALTERTNLGKPRWQPFVPRSPRNRAYLDEGAVSAVRQPRDIGAPALPAMSVGPAARIGGGESAHDHGEVDLVQGRFARVGGPDTKRYSSSMLGNTCKSSVLPPERRAAALARIDKRMAEKKRATRRDGHDKENMRP